MRRSDTHTAPVEAVNGGRVRKELRPELYMYGAVCVPTILSWRIFGFVTPQNLARMLKKRLRMLGDHAAIIANWWQVAFLSPIVRYLRQCKSSIRQKPCHFRKLGKHSYFSSLNFVLIYLFKCTCPAAF